MSAPEQRWTVQAAADHLATDLSIRLTRNDLFRELVDRGWATKTTTGYCPTSTAYSLLDLQPAAAGRLIWDQLLITPTGLGLLRALLTANHLVDTIQEPTP
jgi:hypothetical protein